MKRIVTLGMGQGGLWLACAGQELPAGARVIPKEQARFWLRQSVPPMAHPNILHALSEIADALGYRFHGANAMAFDEVPMVLEWLEDALKAGRLIGFHTASLEGGGKGPSPEPEPPKPPEPKPDPVSPVIEPATLVVVVKKLAKNPASGAQEPYTHPKRQALTLKTDKAFDGTATFTCDKADKVKFFSAAKNGTEIKFDGTANVFKPGSAPPWAPKGTTISSGVTIYAEGAAPSDKMDDIKVKLALSGGSKPIGPEDTATITSVEVTLDIHKSQPDAATAPAFSKDDKVHVGRDLLVQDKAGHFFRGKLVIQKVKPADFKGELVLKAKNGNVDAFKDQKWKTPEASALPFTIAADKIGGSGEVLWAQGKAASADLKDTGFVLGIKNVEDEGDMVTATAIHIQLDICKTRTKKGVDPDALTEEDKVKVGRFVHEQDTDKHHGRALLIVREVKPKKFKGKLVLKGLNAKTELYPNERPKAGEAVTAVPHEIDYAAEKNEDKKFWVQGKSVSAALRDAGYFLHLKDDPQANADTVLMTVVKFSNLKADIPATPAQTARTIGGVAAANQAARHTLTISGGSPDHWDFDDAKNQALVLIEDSIRGASPINMSVTIAPAVAAPHISWHAPRDIRPAPDGDHADIAKLSGSPTLTRNAADHTKATLLANGVGTFHVSPFIDVNGSGKFEPTIDREPYLTMNLILVRVQGKRNDSVAGTSARASTRAAGAAARAAGTVLTAASPQPSSAGGAMVLSGQWTPATTAAYSKATVKLIGGGDKGRRGIETTAGGMDRVHAGWCQHIAASGSSASAPQGLDIFAQYMQMVPNPAVMPPGVPPLPPIPTLRREFFVFTQSGAAGTTFRPPAAAPVVEPCPVLDVTPLGAGSDGVGGDSCTGQWGGHGPFTALAKGTTIVDKALGQEWTVDTLDSPSVGLGPTHAHFPGATMIAFRFNIDFRVDLVFWTNITGVAANSGDPADRLYSSVQTNNWTVAYGCTFNAAGAINGAPTVTVTMTKDASPTRRATPVEGSGLETRFPSALSVFSRDSMA